MKLAQSRLTTQGQVSVPAEVRRRLGVAPGSVIEWVQEEDALVVRRARRHTSEDIHHVLFPDGARTARSLSELREGVRAHMRRRHARD